MDSLASGLGGLLAGLPPVGPFLFLTIPIFALAAGLLFAVRKTAALTAVRREADRFLGWLVAGLLLTMVFLSGLQILLRNLFDTGLLWIDPLLRRLLLVLAFAGAILATGAKRHVQINVLGRLVRGPARRFAGPLVAFLAGGVCLALAHASLELLRDELEFGEIAFLAVPSWLVVLVLPVSFFALAYRFFDLGFLEVVGEAPASPEEEMSAETS